MLLFFLLRTSRCHLSNIGSMYIEWRECIILNELPVLQYLYSFPPPTEIEKVEGKKRNLSNSPTSNHIHSVISKALTTPFGYTIFVWLIKSEDFHAWKIFALFFPARCVPPARYTLWEMKVERTIFEEMFVGCEKKKISGSKWGYCVNRHTVLTNVYTLLGCIFGLMFVQRLKVNLSTKITECLPFNFTGRLISVDFQPTSGVRTRWSTQHFTLLSLDKQIFIHCAHWIFFYSIRRRFWSALCEAQPNRRLESVLILRRARGWK